MYACHAVTCHLHFWQNDRDLLRATVVTRGWNGYRNKSQHRKSTLEKKILPPFQQGFEPATFQSRVRRSNHWATPPPPPPTPPPPPRGLKWRCVFIMDRERARVSRLQLAWLCIRLLGMLSGGLSPNGKSTRTFWTIIAVLGLPPTHPPAQPLQCKCDLM